MSLIVSVSGLQAEWNIAKTVASALYGAAVDNLGNVVPVDCTGLVSFGVCGGLDPKCKRGSLVIPSFVTTADHAYPTDLAWNAAIQATLEAAAVVPCELGVNALSDPHLWVTDPADRAAQFARTGCGILDNESCAVAAFATAHKLPFVVLRAVSDESDDTVINDPNEVTPTGGVNILVDIRDFIVNPAAVIHEAVGFNAALDTLRKTALALGPGLKAP